MSLDKRVMRLGFLTLLILGLAWSTNDPIQTLIKVVIFFGILIGGMLLLEKIKPSWHHAIMREINARAIW